MELLHKAMRMNSLSDAMQDRSLIAIQSWQSLKGAGPIPSIISELINEKIIEKADELSFILNNKKLVVNGTVQPRDVHMRFKDQYLKHEKDHVIYSASQGSVRTDVFLDNK